MLRKLSQHTRAEPANTEEHRYNTNQLTSKACLWVNILQVPATQETLPHQFLQLLQLLLQTFLGGLEWNHSFQRQNQRQVSYFHTILFPRRTRKLHPLQSCNATVSPLPAKLLEAQCCPQQSQQTTTRRI